MNRFLNGRHALVIRGSGGVGAAVSRMLANVGASVLVHGGRDRARLDRTVDECRANGAKARGLLVPIDRAEDAQPIIDAAGDPDILVIAFGPWLERPIDTTSIAEWRMLTETNLLLPAFLLSALLPGMRLRRYGRVILFGGPRSDRILGFRRIGAYAAAKAALASLARSVATQYAGEGIRCNMIAPGYVETEYLTLEQTSRIRERRPTGRLVQPDQIAALCRALLDDSLDAVNGAIIPVDYGE